MNTRHRARPFWSFQVQDVPADAVEKAQEKAARQAADAEAAAAAQAEGSEGEAAAAVADEEAPGTGDADFVAQAPAGTQPTRDVIVKYKVAAVAARQRLADARAGKLAKRARKVGGRIEIG